MSNPPRRFRAQLPPPAALAVIVFFILLRWTLIFGFWCLFLLAVLLAALGKVHL